MMQKRAVIGLDAAEMRFIQSHLGALPNLAAALRAGNLFRLESTGKHMAGSVWPTVYTGTMPGHHGIHHHLQWDAEHMRMRRVTNDWRPTKPFWRTLDEKGVRVIAFDVQAVSPTLLRNGIEIVSWGSHDQLAPYQTFPASIDRELTDHIGRHPMAAEMPVSHSASELQRLKQDLVNGAAVKGRAIRYLAENHPWDLFLSVFGETHRGGHLFWPASENDFPADLLHIYQAIDKALGELVEFFHKQNATVTILACHGMGFNTSQEHFARSIMDRANERFLQRTPHPVKPPSKFPVMQWLRRRVPAQVQNIIAQRVPVGVRDWVVSREVISGLDWETTPGLSVLSDLHGYIRAAVRGREARGWFEPGSSALSSYLDWLERCFRSLRVANTNTPLVMDVARSDSTYPGPARHSLPDLIVVWNDVPAATHVTSDLLGSFTGHIATGRAGNHRPDGFIIIPRDDDALNSASPPKHIVDLASLFSNAT